MRSIIVHELIGKRCLLRVTTGSYLEKGVTEYRIVEISPSGNWVKLQNIYGNKYWKAICDVLFVEELIDLKAARKKETGENDGR